MYRSYAVLIGLIVVSLTLTSCGPGQLLGPKPTPTPTSTATPAPTATSTSTATPTATPTATSTPTVTPTVTPTATPAFDPAAVATLCDHWWQTVVGITQSCLAHDASSLASCKKFTEDYQTTSLELPNTASEEMHTDIEEYEGALVTWVQTKLQYLAQCVPSPKSADAISLCMQLLIIEGGVEDAYIELSEALSEKYCADWWWTR